MSEPIYITKEDDYSGPHGNQPPGSPFALREDFVEKMKGLAAVRGWWMCPECKMEFTRLVACKKHMGLVPPNPAYCLVMAGNLVRLTIEEWNETQREAELWYRESIKRGDKPAYGCKWEDALAMNKVGTPCERAMYKWAREPWRSTEGTYRAPDLLGTFQIRGGQGSDYCLRAHDTDEDKRIMVLVLPTNRYLVYRIVGWETAKFCKNKKAYWRTWPGQEDRPAYFVPQKDLRSWRDLPKMIEEARLAFAR